jgi:RNA polymerase sigma-70 factor (ECF subfamily)
MARNVVTAQEQKFFAYFFQKRRPFLLENGQRGLVADTEIDVLSELLQRCLDGDEAALQRIYDLQAPRLKGLALRITNNPAMAEDVVHDVFLKIWHAPDQFDPERGSARAWLTMLTRFRALELVRRSGRERATDQMPDIEDDAPDALARVMADSQGRVLAACLQALTPRARSALLLAFNRGLTHAEIASTYNMPLGTLKSLIRRGLRDLKQCMDR